MSKHDDVKKEVEEKDKEVYGDETISGSNPAPQSDDDVEEVMEDAMGEDAVEDIKEDKDGFNIADEINEDEEEAADSPIEDYQTKEGLDAEAFANPEEDGEEEE